MKPANGDTELVKISKLARLSGVPAPTIKHYMREGLLPQPAQRTSRNMAYYDPRLADRVRMIKVLQQTHFLPLKLIGDLLEPAPSGNVRGDLDPETRDRLGTLAPAIREGREKSRHVTDQAAVPRKRSRKEVLAKLDISAKELNYLESLGLSQAVEDDKGVAWFDGADLDIIEVIDETRKKNMGDLFPMEILEPYAEKVRALVRLELEMFRQRVLDGAQLPDMPMATVAREATALAERLIIGMRYKLVFAELGAIAKPAEVGSAKPASKRRKAATPKGGRSRAKTATKAGAKKAKAGSSGTGKKPRKPATKRGR